jgi:hypothetical protein
MRANTVVALCATYVVGAIAWRASGIIPEDIYEPVCALGGLILLLLCCMLSNENRSGSSERKT